ncbi:hypothetical protein [Hoyosella subflava]|uniref:Asp23/Gls24 family envelope stress response protein n=1 Tax=Hoyosella subflava (strain DSM 45089 / JCM 17490 / NBRC 109087 / DQS3-9A1) TaxID=443218 RepID=F6EGW1_HOYSD|nr:hypothetical protein [Hoyosella subflava]AEF38785.1 hypothetical protein AS9A_0326 [Hoyosella subflava DQS3-9A1]
MALETLPYEDGNDPGNDVVLRAARELRESDTDIDSQWLEITDRVIARVRATTRHGIPIRAESMRGALYVTDLVVRHTLRDALEGLGGTAPLRIDVGVDEARCTGLNIELSALYLTDLRQAAKEVRTAAHSVLTEILGDLAPPRATITLHFGDVTPDAND